MFQCVWPCLPRSPRPRPRPPPRRGRLRRLKRQKQLPRQDLSEKVRQRPSPVQGPRRHTRPLSKRQRKMPSGGAGPRSVAKKGEANWRAREGLPALPIPILSGPSLSYPSLSCSILCSPDAGGVGRKQAQEAPNVFITCRSRVDHALITCRSACRSWFL